MKREWKAFGLAVVVSAAALAGVAGFAQVLRANARASSHELPPVATWPWTTPAPAASPEAIARGAKLFLNTCAHCHGVDAHGDEGPDLHDLQVSDRWIGNVIKTGFEGEMPAFRRKFNDEEIAAIVGYLKGLQ